MRIEVKARTFFEARMGGKSERRLMRTKRIISINNVSFPAEPPPFSEPFLNSDNLLVLYFDDVEQGETAMTPEQAEAIVEFVCRPDPRPLMVHCSAGISRSGAVGSVLNWYFNRYREDNPREYRRFVSTHPDIIPNTHVSHLLLVALLKRHTPDSDRK